MGAALEAIFPSARADNRETSSVAPVSPAAESHRLSEAKAPSNKRTYDENAAENCKRILDAKGLGNDNAVLGVPDGASPQELKAAFRKAAFALHTDKFESLNDGQTETLHKAFTAVADAYDRLKKVTLQEAKTAMNEPAKNSFDERTGTAATTDGASAGYARTNTATGTRGRTAESAPFSTGFGSETESLGGQSSTYDFRGGGYGTWSPGYSGISERLAGAFSGFGRREGVDEILARTAILEARRARWAEHLGFKAESLTVITNLEGLADLTAAVSAMERLRDSRWTAGQVGRVLEALASSPGADQTKVSALVAAFSSVYGGRNINVHLHV